MKEMLSMPLGSVSEYSGASELENEILTLGCSGAEFIWSGGDVPPVLPCPECTGYHMIFYPDWLDLWNGNEAALCAKFGSETAWRSFYGSRETFISQFKDDMLRAEAVKARYVVFHVSDVSIDEGYTYRWLHSNESVIDASADLINMLCGGKEPPFAILVENQWWPGFTFTDPKMTARLLDAIDTKNKGIMLDTGHLMNACADIKSEADGVRYIHDMLNAHGSMAESIRGMHLHCSLSGEYVSKNTGVLPDTIQADYLERYADSYSHILKIDQHRPWSNPAINSVITRISPDYLTHELAVSDRHERRDKVIQQRRNLGWCL